MNDGDLKVMQYFAHAFESMDADGKVRVPQAVVRKWLRQINATRNMTLEQYLEQAEAR